MHSANPDFCSFVDRKKAWPEDFFWAEMMSTPGTMKHLTFVYFTDLLLSNPFPCVFHSQESLGPI